MAAPPSAACAAPAIPGLDAALDFARRACAADPRLDAATIMAAARFAAEAHAAQTRKSGEPYILHPVAVAEILAGYRLDTATIATALLHDVVEDTGRKLSDIADRFGPEVAKLVDGVTKLSRIEVQSERTKQAENLRKLLVAVSEDIRVLLVKLADRLHNMRTLHAVPKPEKRARIARETLDIYAPLAERIGMERLKSELENLAFRELHPDAWQSIQARLTFLRGQSADLIGEIERDIAEVLAANGIKDAEVHGREKTPYSIWRKMKAKDVTFEGLSDVMAFRVIVGTKAECYQALGIIHDAYRVIPGRFKDYISTPKGNRYQSLHTGVTVPARRHAKIEVQIRTREMHQIAEYGVAAHWVYKQGTNDGVEPGRYPWMKALLEIIESAADPQEVLENTKLELHGESVFCFTPKGDLIELPAGATPIDFAYQVHSEVGDTCVGAKVNGKVQPLRQPLANGDQVEIITARGGKPNPDWLNFVVTGRARARIRRFALAAEREKHREEGRAAIAKAFRQDGLEFSEKMLEPALKALGKNSIEDVLIAVGSGQLGPREVLFAAVPELRAQARPAHRLALARPRGGIGAGPALLARDRGEARESTPRGESMGILGLPPGTPVVFPHCCNAIPGEPIVGIVSTGRAIAIHRKDCHTLEAYAATPERFFEVAWDPTHGEARTARLTVKTINDAEVLAGIAHAIARQNGAITTLRVTRQGDECDVQLEAEVRDIRHLQDLMAGLRACQGVIRVDRTRN
ncbi:MAG: bifunctional (p)ppGpp synthetase/guanosine-3',5'-bis(diphosphate) 3'-pyrophosphohydrolase [Rhodovarius sp.]|nr:bifunctional (p)ppGpp synthetase/guanosine-3',5'-bis(diphosphate) 3'-pyrophosphohydrolase [Rhodovarius sp.]